MTMAGETAEPFPVGPPVDPTPAKRPARLTLEGRFVRLVPLQPEHAEALYEGSHGEDAERLWAYLSPAPFADRASFRNYIARSVQSEDPLFFAILDATGRAVGHATYMRVTPEHRVIEVGNILYTPALQRTPGGTEAMYLMARHAFEDLGYRRYEWKCNALNAPSRRAAERYGFNFEGVFRQHMIVKGLSRDTAWYAMLDTEWSARKAAFERWLAPDNFDADGRQKIGLAELMGARV
jgi:RimJ/RimL family protein N-acetyltransferase